MASQSRCEADWLTNVSCETRVKTSKFSCTWTLHKFSMHREDTGTKVESSTFSTAGDGDMKWRLQLYPRGDEEERKEFVSLYLQYVSCLSSYKDVLVEYKFAVLDEGGQKVSVQQSTSLFSRGGFHGFPKFIERDRLLKGIERLLPNDKLTIYCEGLVFVRFVNIPSENASALVKVPDCDLSEDFGRLLVSRRFSDVILSVEGAEIQAHRDILAARSPVFAAMFDHNMKEKQQGRVEIADCDFEVLHEVIEFIYTGRAPKLNEMAEKILVAANKYDLARLKAMCERVLSSKLSVETAAQTLILADMHNADQLKAETLKFIKEDAEGVIKTDGWKVMASNKPHLVEETLCALVL